MNRLKPTSLLAFLFFFFAGIAWAVLVPDSDPDENRLASVQDGAQFFIRSERRTQDVNWTNGYRWIALRTPYEEGKELPITLENDGTQLTDEGLFTVEATGSQVIASDNKSYDAFYIKNVKCGKYLSVAATSGDATFLRFTDEKSSAVVWGFRPVAASEDEADEYNTGKWLIFTITNNGEFYLNVGDLDYNGIKTPFYGPWADMPGWFDLIPPETAEADLINQHLKLYEDAMAYGNTDDDGHYVLLGGIGGYSDELMQEYYEVMFYNTDDLMDMEFKGQTVDWETSIANLEAMIIKLQNAVPQMPADGYYLIVSAYSPWSNESNYRAIYAKKDVVYWGELGENATNPAYIWKFTKKEDGTYSIQNLAEGQYFTACVNNGAAKLTNDADFGAQIHLLGNGQMNIQVGDGGGGNYVHPKGHSGGTGTQGTITGYPGGKDSQSAWRLIAVSEDVYGPYLEQMQRMLEMQEVHNELTERITAVRSASKAAFEYEVPAEAVNVTPLAAADFESNSAMSAEHGLSWGSDGQGFGALIDDDYSTWFHTCWTSSASEINWTAYNPDGTPAEGATQTTLHNLSMKLSQPASDVSFQVSARKGGYNNPTKIDVEVSADGIHWITVFYGYDFFTPTTQAESPYIMGPFDLGGSYEYVRFANYGNDRNADGSRFFCFSELRAYSGVRLTSTCQASTMDQTIVSNFLAAYSAANKYVDMPTYEELEDMRAALSNLNAAFEAFKSAFADPTDLKSLISTAQNVIANYKVGEGTVGLYDGSLSTDNLETAISNAIDVLDAGFYTQQTLKDEVDKINTELERLNATVIQPRTDKWYQLVFPSEEEYDENPSWDKDNVQHNGEGELALFSRVAAIMDGDDSTPFEDIEALRESDNLHLYPVHESTIADAPEVSYFRFVPVKDGYALQNKATGLYIAHMKQSAHAAMSSWPGVYKLQTLGQGFSILQSHDFKTGEYENGTIQFTWNGNIIVGWVDTEIGTKASIHIREVDVDFDGDPVMRRSAVEEQAFGLTLAANVTQLNGAEAYVPAGIYYDETGEEAVTFIGLKKVEAKDGNIIQPGQPVIVFPDDEVVEFTLGTQLTDSALWENYLCGTFQRIAAIEPGSAALQYDEDEDLNYFQVTGGAIQRSVNAFSAYLALQDGDELAVCERQSDCDVWILLRGKLNGASVMPVGADCPLNGDVYDIAGHKVGTAKSISLLKRGIYVVNGKKIIIM